MKAEGKSQKAEVRNVNIAHCVWFLPCAFCLLPSAAKPRSVPSAAKPRCWWARQDSNLEPAGYEPAALTVVLQAPRRGAGTTIDRQGPIWSFGWAGPGAGSRPNWPALQSDRNDLSSSQGARIDRGDV